MSARCINLSDYSNLQSAIDAVPEYGTLFVPPGEWHCGAGRLKSNMTLFLAKGARLIAPKVLSEHVPWPELGRQHLHNCCFLALYDLDNVTVAGEGIIDCSGHNFWSDYDHAPSSISPRDPVSGRYAVRQYLPLPMRPSGIMMINSSNISIKGITVYDSAGFTVWTLGCRQVRLDGIAVDNIRRGPNTDALDIDCSSDVWITNCHLSAGDDCIALKSDIALLGRNQPCERIHIANNTMTSQCCGVRIGYEGDGEIRDVVMNNNIIYESNIGLDMLSVIPDQHKKRKIFHGCRISNILVDNMIIRQVRQAIKLWSYVENEEMLSEHTGFIRNVSLRNMYIEAVNASFIGGKSVEDIFLKNIRMHVKRACRRSEAGEIVSIPSVWGDGYLPDPLTIYQVKNLTMENVRVTEEYSE